MCNICMIYTCAAILALCPHPPAPERRPPSACEVIGKGETGHGVEAEKPLTQMPYAISSYALICVAWAGGNGSTFWERRAGAAKLRNGTNEVSTNGVAANFVVFDRDFLGTPVNCYLPKSARAYLFPQSVKKTTFAAVPLVLTSFYDFTIVYYNILH